MNPLVWVRNYDFLIDCHIYKYSRGEKEDNINETVHMAALNIFSVGL
jgi:hypothetical protein